MNAFDVINLTAILNDKDGKKYDWANAHILRFLNVTLAKADSKLLPKLLATFPDQCVVIYRYYGWDDPAIRGLFNRYDLVVGKL